MIRFRHAAVIVMIFGACCAGGCFTRTSAPGLPYVEPASSVPQRDPMSLQLATRLQEHETELQRLREMLERLQGLGENSQAIRNLQERVAQIERQLGMDPTRSGPNAVQPLPLPRAAAPPVEPRPEAPEPVAPPPGRVATRPPGDVQAPPIELRDTPVPAEEKLFRDAYSLLSKGSTDQAAALFEELLQRYPKGMLTADALYWIGECRFAQRRYDEAVLQFDRVLKEFPGSKKELDALLKQGQSFEKMGDRKSARIIFQKLVNDSPHTAQARIAAGRLKALPQE